MGRPNKGERDQLKARAPKTVAAQLRAAAKAAGKTLSDYLIAAGLALATQGPALAIAAIAAQPIPTTTEVIYASDVPRELPELPVLPPTNPEPLAPQLPDSEKQEPSPMATDDVASDQPSTLEIPDPAQLTPEPNRDLKPEKEEPNMPILPEVLAALPPHADPTPACTHCHQQLIFVAGERYTEARRCPKCEEICPRCKGVGEWFDETYYGGSGAYIGCECGKKTIARRIAVFNQAEIPAAYSDLLIGKLPIQTLTDSQKTAHLQAFKWAQSFDKREGREAAQGLFFYGPPGTGKTLALCRALAYVGRYYGRSIRYVHLPDYLAQRKAAWSDEEIEVSALQELERIDVLLIDEIVLKDKGRRRPLQNWDREQLNLLLHARWNAQLPTLFATNCTPEEIESEVAESSWSRIYATSTMLQVEGADLRRPALVTPAAPQQPPKPKRNDHLWRKTYSR